MIKQFKGKYRWLSNFGLSPFITPTMEEYQTNEHFYQAMKADTYKDRRYVQEASTPAIAKKRGREIKVRPDWDNVKLEMMELGLRLKFNQNPDLAQQLLDTGDQMLYEGNTWGDRYWGVDLAALDRGEIVGENHLGKLLMKIRKELKRNE